MLAIRTRFDGKKIQVPDEVKQLPPGDVIILFEDQDRAGVSSWLKIQEQALVNAWDDKEDSIYDEA